MTHLKSLFVLLAFLSLFNVSQAAKQTATFIMWAEGNGETVKAAKMSAVTALSQQIISRVESSFKTELSVANDEINRDSKSIKKIDSNLILKGVIYVDEVKSNGNIKITAGLDRAAIRSTIDYMQKQLNVNFSILSRDKKEEKLQISDQLTAFVSVLPASILNDFDNIEVWNKNKRDLILKNIFMGRVVFISNTPEYTVKVDEKTVGSGVFLESANYEFTASAKGQRTMNGRFFASGGETIKVKLNFVKTVSNKKITLKLPSEYGFLRENLTDTLSDIGISIAQNATNMLSVRIKNTSSQVDGYVSYRLKVRIEAFQSNTRIKKVTVSKNIIVEHGDENAVQKEIDALVRKGTVALMSKMDLDAFFEG